MYSFDFLELLRTFRKHGSQKPPKAVYLVQSGKKYRVNSFTFWDDDKHHAQKGHASLLLYPIVP